VLCPMNRGTLGVRELNASLQNALNPVIAGEPVVEKIWLAIPHPRQGHATENNYDKMCSMATCGQIAQIEAGEREIVVKYDQRDVVTVSGNWTKSAGICDHDPQGPRLRVPDRRDSHRHATILLLQRNLLYTAITRGKKLVVLVGQPKPSGWPSATPTWNAAIPGLLARLEATEPDIKTDSSENWGGLLCRRPDEIFLWQVFTAWPIPVRLMKITSSSLVLWIVAIRRWESVWCASWKNWGTRSIIPRN